MKACPAKDLLHSYAFSNTVEVLTFCKKGHIRRAVKCRKLSPEIDHVRRTEAPQPRDLQEMTAQLGEQHRSLRDAAARCEAHAAEAVEGPAKPEQAGDAEGAPTAVECETPAPAASEPAAAPQVEAAMNLDRS